MKTFKYELNANYCARMNAKSYSYKPRFISARAAKKINSQPITFTF